MIFTDDIGRKVELKTKINRIVSLVPSITELLFDINLSTEIIACTNYCVHPKRKVQELIKVGGTKDFDLDKIRQAKPDLIIAVKEENNRDLVLEIAKEFPTIVFDIINLKSALSSINAIGQILNKQEEAENLTMSIESELLVLKDIIKYPKLSVAYLIWNNPLMSIGKGTYISDLIDLSGYSNIFEEKDKAYFELSKIELEALKPDFIFLSSEPFNFTEKHKIIYKKQYPDSKLVLVDGKMFSWYGSRILKAIPYFIDLYKNIIDNE